MFTGESLAMKRAPTIWSEHLVDGIIYPEFPENSMYEFLVERTAAALDSIALEFEGTKTTYAELLLQIDRTASSLLYLGVEKGDIITIISPNIPQALFTIYAANKIGAICNILHPLLPSKEMVFHIENTDSKAVFILDQIYGKIEGIKWKEQPPSIIVYSIAEVITTVRGVMSYVV